MILEYSRCNLGNRPIVKNDDSYLYAINNYKPL